MLAFAVVVVVVVVLSECLPLLMAGRGDWLRVGGSKQQVREKEREREGEASGRASEENE